MAIPEEKAMSLAMSFKDEVRMKKEGERIELGDNLYSILVVAPATSWSFMLSIFFLFIKFTALVILILGISWDNVEAPTVEVSVVKAFLIPVAIAMQEDLMGSFATLANGRWSSSLLRISTSATQFKLYFGYLLRAIDGFMSLYVNYSVMLVTPGAVAVFLNFAALQFIYSIDDVFFELMTLGFFGDEMEHMTTVCQRCSLPRRHGKYNPHIGCIRVSWLDTILFLCLLVVLVILYILFSIDLYEVADLTPGN